MLQQPYLLELLQRSQQPGFMGVRVLLEFLPSMCGGGGRGGGGEREWQ